MIKSKVQIEKRAGRKAPGQIVASFSLSLFPMQAKYSRAGSENQMQIMEGKDTVPVDNLSGRG